MKVRVLPTRCRRRWKSWLPLEQIFKARSRGATGREENGKGLRTPLLLTMPTMATLWMWMGPARKNRKETTTTRRRRREEELDGDELDEDMEKVLEQAKMRMMTPAWKICLL